MTTDAPDVTKKDGIERRSVIKAAAWAAPVVALAATTPMAAASVDSSKLTVASGSTLSLSGPNRAGSTVSGQFGGSASVANMGSGWDVDGMTASYLLEGPVSGTTYFTHQGSPINTDGVTIVEAGYTWLVTSAFAGQVEMTLASPIPVPVPANGSATVPVPVLGYSDTLTRPATYNPIGSRVRASLLVTATSGGVTLDDTNLKSFPAAP